MADAKFSVGSVFPITMPLHPRIGFKIIYAWTFMCNLSALKVLRKSHQNRLTHLRVTVVNRLGHCSSHQLNEWHCAWHKSLTSYSIWYLYYYRPQTKFGARLYFQKRVSRILSTGGSASVHARIPPPQDQAGTPLGPGSPPGPDTPPGPGNLGDQAPPGTRHPPEQSMLGDTVNERAVHILLKCILVCWLN